MWQREDTTRVYKKGDIIIKEGDLGREMFIIQSGSVEITKKQDNEEITVARLGRGDSFGEMALMENMPRIATATAQETTTVIVLNIGNFMIKIRKDPAFAYSIMQKLSHRLRLTTERMLELTKEEDKESSGKGPVSTVSEYFKKYFERL